MIKQTEALVAAREALIGHGAECKEVNDALALIDAALGVHTLCDECETASYCLANGCIPKQQPAPVQPVAWQIRSGDSPDWTWADTEADADFYGKQSGLHYEKRPLYTTPPAAQPAPVQPAIRAMGKQMKTVIEMALEAGFKQHNGMVYVTTINDDCAKEIKRFEAIVRADERERVMNEPLTKANWQRFEDEIRADEREKSLSLWMLLDDVDTADDIAKANDAIYRNLCRQAHAKRWGILTGDEVDAAIRARGNT